MSCLTPSQPRMGVKPWSAGTTRHDLRHSNTKVVTALISYIIIMVIMVPPGGH